MVTQRSAARVEFMDRIIDNLDKNVIVFAHNTEYINFLTKHFKERFPDRQIKKITGSTTLKKRQQAIDEMLEANNVVLVGSFGAVGTGLTFKNVDYVIFAQSFKSEIIVNQSLGRAMLRTPDKKVFYLYDLIDVFPGKKIYNQGLAKVRSYNEHKYKYEIVKEKLPFKDVFTSSLPQS
jgi:type I site-specific restriction endonuclease